MSTESTEIKKKKKKIIHACRDQKKEEVLILIFDKIDFMPKNITRGIVIISDKEISSSRGYNICKY